NISGGSDLGLFEVNEAAEIIHGVAHPDANIIAGMAIDDAMGDEVRVTVIAAGFDRWDEGKDRRGGRRGEGLGLMDDDVFSPGGGAGQRADAAVTDRPGCALAILTADCAPVALIASDGVVGVAHAGWRGLVGGVLERTVQVMRAGGASDVRALLGPCIRPGCYEFGADDLAQVARRLGDGVRATT